jgi:hypothetical protein
LFSLLPTESGMFLLPISGTSLSATMKFEASHNLSFQHYLGNKIYRMLQAGLLSFKRHIIVFYQLFLSLFFCHVGLCVGKVFIFLYRGRFFVFFSGLEKAYSFASFGCIHGLCGLQMCMHLCVGILIFV